MDHQAGRRWNVLVRRTEWLARISTYQSIRRRSRRRHAAKTVWNVSHDDAASIEGLAEHVGYRGFPVNMPSRHAEHNEPLFASAWPGRFRGNVWVPRPKALPRRREDRPTPVDRVGSGLRRTRAA